MYLIDSTVKRLPYFSGFQSFSLGFASINDDNINFISLREVIQSTVTVLYICAWFKLFLSFIIKHRGKIFSVLSYLFTHIPTSILQYNVTGSLAVKLILNYTHLPWCRCISLKSYQQDADVHGSLSHLTLDAYRLDTYIYSGFFRIYFQML